MIRSLVRTTLTLVVGLALTAAPGLLHAQGVAEYLDDLKEFRITDATLTQFLKGLAAEKKANDAARQAMEKGDIGGMGAIGSLMKCMPTPGAEPDLAKMGQCGGSMASEKSPQEQASGLEDRVFEGMKQRLWIYFDGKPAEKKAHFSTAELAAVAKQQGPLAAHREQFVSPHPEC